jgi:phosphonoacetate hydrolase
MAQPLTINGRTYGFPTDPVVVICIDGSEPAYIEDAVAAGQAPTLARFMKEGANLIAECVIPSYTNPNNLSIITGRPPAVHGIGGNFIFDRQSGKELMLNHPKFLRAPTILSAFHDAGAKVAMVTAKDKLRLLLSAGLDFGSGRAIAFSSERADKATTEDSGVENVVDLVGMRVPDVYSAELSEFVFAAGVKLLQSFRPELMYLSTTDYIQHKRAPGTKDANYFYGMIDRYLAELDALGATIVVTADHGMNDKHGHDGLPDVVYLEPLLKNWLGEGRSRVTLTITDPYVVHHGSLGSFATIYVDEDVNITDLLGKLRAHPGIEVALDRSEACVRFELPPDRMGDIIVLSTCHKTLGSSPEKHDLSVLDEPLRSHGGLTEQRVPMILNRRVTLPKSHGLRNFDAFALALSHLSPS